jgi:hypothetical protein
MKTKFYYESVWLKIGTAQQLSVKDQIIKNLFNGLGPDARSLTDKHMTLT